MKVRVVPVTPLQQNCSILACEKTGAAAIVDPGGDLDLILAEIEAAGLRPEKILLTHGHVDHCAGAPELARRLGIPIEGPHPADAFWIDQLPVSTVRYGMPRVDPFVPSRWLAGGDEVRFGDETMQVIHCPGHTPGHVVFYSAPMQLAFVGDVLFAGSIGRTDFPRGNHADLLSSIRNRLWPLGNEVTFVPGHGPVSTFGQERRTNPFVRDGAVGS